MKKNIELYEENFKSFFQNLKEKDFENAKCIFCRKPSSEYEIFTKDSMRVVRCECGFIYNSRQPNQLSLGRFYKTSDAMKTWSVHKTTPEQIKKQTEKFELAASILEKKVDSVLDLGCGTGFFISLLSEKINKIGVDTHDESLNVAKKYGVEVILGDIYTLNEFSDNSFGAITLWGVLEHIKNPIEILRQVRVKLKPGGFVVICVPNVDSSIVRRFWKDCFTFCPQHLWYFSFNTLQLALRRTGFKLYDSYSIEPEERPVIKGMHGLHPYAEIPSYLEKQIMIPELIDKLKKNILMANQGYKIVTLARK